MELFLQIILKIFYIGLALLSVFIGIFTFLWGGEVIRSPNTVQSIIIGIAMLTFIAPVFYMIGDIFFSRHMPDFSPLYVLILCPIVGTALWYVAERF